MAEIKEREVYKIHINGSIEAVWRELTKTRVAHQAFFNMHMHTPGLAVGAPFQMRSKNGKYTGAVGEVLEWDPPRRYKHTFKFTNLDDPPCTVEYNLREVDGGVEFTLTRDGAAPGTKTAKQMSQGSMMILKTLKKMVERGKPSLGVRMLFLLFRVMEPLTPKRSLTSNWPMDSRTESAG